MASRMLAQNPDALIATSSSKYDPKVAQLQQTLNAEGYRDQNGRPLAVDGVMGPLTQYASQQKAGALANNVAGGYDPARLNAIVSGVEKEKEINRILRNAGTGGNVGSSVRNTPTSISAMNPQIGKLFATLQSRASASLPSVESTPQYAAAKTRLQQEGAEASTRAVQGMAARGVLRSSMTEDAMKKIEAEIVDRLTTQVAPAVQQQLLSQRESELGGIRSDLATALQMAGMDASQAMQAAQMAEQGRQFDIGQMVERARLEQSIGSERLNNLYRLADLTGTIPEGLPGAGGLTAEERYRQQQLAASLARANQPEQVDYMDQLLQSALEGLNSGGSLNPAQQAAFDRWMGAQAGVAGVTDNALFDEAIRRVQQGEMLLPGEAGYDARVQEIYQALRAAFGRAPARVPTATQPTAAPAPSVNDEIERKRRELGY
jgi:peptidoglycan hydrolase-like protein with peptidoglycan-binding domain